MLIRGFSVLILLKLLVIIKILLLRFDLLHLKLRALPLFIKHVLVLMLLGAAVGFNFWVRVHQFVLLRISYSLMLDIKAIVTCYAARLNLLLLLKSLLLFTSVSALSSCSLHLMCFKVLFFNYVLVS